MTKLDVDAHIIIDGKMLKDAEDKLIEMCYKSGLQLLSWRQHEEEKTATFIKETGYERLWFCSKCNGLVRVLYKYCPWCGAKMEEDETDEDAQSL